MNEITVTFTEKELKMLATLVSSTPVHGTLQTLPNYLKELTAIYIKLTEKLG